MISLDVVWDDVAWDRFHDIVADDVVRYQLTDRDAHIAWTLGLKAFLVARRLGAQFPHHVNDPEDSHS